MSPTLRESLRRGAVAAPGPWTPDARAGSRRAAPAEEFRPTWASLAHTPDAEGLRVTLPERRRGEHVLTFEISGQGITRG
jgi:hypothetical protein